ncbi:MAG: hypothetical protein GF419_12940 [Ignavibacteriales bacterium]|nr:hypothetical protein [Ignavibacteriales bacterium]
MRRALFLWSLLLAALATAARAQPITVTGETLKGTTLDGEAIREVIGDVVLTQGDVVVTCDKAIHFLDRNDARLVGDVVAVQRNLTIRTPEGFYYGDERRAYSNAGVELDDKKVVLTAEEGEYFFDDKIAIFVDSVRLYDTATTLDAARLLYYRGDDRAVATGDVRARDSVNTIFADSLIHFRQSQVTYGYFNVQIQNREDDVFILGERLEDYRRQKYSVMRINAALVQLDSTVVADTIRADSASATVVDSVKVDTLVIRAEKLEAFRDSTNRYVAEDSVRMRRTDFASRNDRAVFYRSEDRILVVKLEEREQPIMWYETAQLLGDSVVVELRENQIRRIDAVGDAMTASRPPDYPQRLDQISGEEMTMRFGDDGLERVEVSGEVKSIYYIYEDGAPNGVVKATASSAAILVEEGLVSVVKLYGDPDSEYHPERLARGAERTFLLPTFEEYREPPDKDRLLEGIVLREPDAPLTLDRAVAEEEERRAQELRKRNEELRELQERKRREDERGDRRDDKRGDRREDPRFRDDPRRDDPRRDD